METLNYIHVYFFITITITSFFFLKTKKEVNSKEKPEMITFGSDDGNIDIRNLVLRRYINQQSKAYTLYYSSILILVILVILLISFYFFNSLEGKRPENYYITSATSIIINGGFIKFSKSLYDKTSSIVNKYILEKFND